MSRQELKSLAHELPKDFHEIVKTDPNVPPSIIRLTSLIIYEDLGLTPSQIIESALSFDTWKEPTDEELKNIKNYPHHPDMYKDFFYDLVRKRMHEKYKDNSQ